MMLPFSVISKGDEISQQTINTEIKTWISSGNFWRKNCTYINNISNADGILAIEIKRWIRNKEYWSNLSD